jgi:hypothetical protein
MDASSVDCYVVSSRVEFKKSRGSHSRKHKSCLRKIQFFAKFLGMFMSQGLSHIFTFSSGQYSFKASRMFLMPCFVLAIVVA